MSDIQYSIHKYLKERRSEERDTEATIHSVKLLCMLQYKRQTETRALTDCINIDEQWSLHFLGFSGRLPSSSAPVRLNSSVLHIWTLVILETVCICYLIFKQRLWEVKSNQISVYVQHQDNKPFPTLSSHDGERWPDCAWQPVSVIPCHSGLDILVLKRGFWSSSTKAYSAQRS